MSFRYGSSFSFSGNTKSADILHSQNIGAEEQNIEFWGCAFFDLWGNEKGHQPAGCKNQQIDALIFGYLFLEKWRPFWGKVPD